MPSDSSAPEFWDTRFRDGVTPWDAGAAPKKLAEWLRARATGRVLIPGCGSGYEVRLFAESGWDVLAIDFSEAAIQAAHSELGRWSSLLQQADFFRLQTPPFDLVYERAFLCALPRARWPDWGKHMADLVRPGGALAGFFYLDDNQRGPPFGTSSARLNELLGPAFELAESEPVPAGDSIPVFQGKEIWQVWKRRL